MKLPIIAALAVGLSLTACKLETEEVPAQVEEPAPQPPQQIIINTEQGKAGFISGLECMHDSGDAESCTVACAKNQDSDTIAGCLKAVDFMSDELPASSILTD